MVGSGTRKARARLQRQRGVTEGEDEAQAVVLDPALVTIVVVETIAPVRSVPFIHHALLRRLFQQLRAAPLTAQTVDRPVLGDGRQPRARAVRDAVRGPAPQSLREGLLSAFLGQVPVAGAPNEGRDDAPPFLRERLRDRRAGVGSQSAANGRTSSEPIRATGCLPATSIASSRSAHSRMSKPAISSLVSANGPSVSTTSPPRTRTVVALSLRCSSWPRTRTPRPSISSTHASVSGPMFFVDSGVT